MAFKAILLLVSVAMAATSIAGAQNAIGVVQVNGTLYCSIDLSPGGGANTSPVFPDAEVQVSCTGNEISNSPVTTTKNSNGVYVLTLTPQPSATIESIITNCRIIVITPLSSCNAKLASAGLVSNLPSAKTDPHGSSAITYMIFIHYPHDLQVCAPRVAAASGHEVIVWVCLVST